jgi:hypothetical protein
VQGVGLVLPSGALPVGVPLGTPTLAVAGPEAVPAASNPWEVALALKLPPPPPPPPPPPLPLLQALGVGVVLWLGVLLGVARGEALPLALPLSPPPCREALLLPLQHSEGLREGLAHAEAVP